MCYYVVISKIIHTFVKINIMKEIKVVDGYFLYYDPLMKMYIIKFGEIFSLWFNINDANEFINLSDEDFIEKCAEYLNTTNE